MNAARLRRSRHGCAWFALMIFPWSVVAMAEAAEISDPDRRIPWAIANSFTAERRLTDVDVRIDYDVTMPDGTRWLADGLGPFLLHADSRGRLITAPIEVPDPHDGRRSWRFRTHPGCEEGAAPRVMAAFARHAAAHGAIRPPVVSPWHLLVDDGDPRLAIPHRQAPPAGSGLSPASSKIFSPSSLRKAGHPVVVWTVNDAPRMRELMRAGVSGLMSDRPDLLRREVAGFDANGDGRGGDLLDADGLIDPAKFDAQGHRGARDLRPENTLPAMEAALDSLMTTLETDCAITADGSPVLSHDPYLSAAQCRRVDGQAYDTGHEMLIHKLTAAELRRQFVRDKLDPARPLQRANPAESPVAAAWAAGVKCSPYVVPTLDELFQFVAAYVDYYRAGPGRDHPEAARRWKNAAGVRFNIETKINPRREYAARTCGVAEFATAVAQVIARRGLEQRADIQSFDFRTLLFVQEHYPKIRTVYLFGDFPIAAGQTGVETGDGTNLQPADGHDSPWLAGLPWPYRDTNASHPLAAADCRWISLKNSRVADELELEFQLGAEESRRAYRLKFDTRTNKFSSPP